MITQSSPLLVYKNNDSLREGKLQTAVRTIHHSCFEYHAVFVSLIYSEHCSKRYDLIHNKMHDFDGLILSIQKRLMRQV